TTGGTGQFTYSWTRNGATISDNTEQITNLAPGYYQAWIKDVNTGCQVQTELIGITQPYPLSFEYQATSPMCADSQTGTLEIYPNGGTAPYTLSILQNDEVIYQLNGYDDFSQDQLLA
ncbi:hypothetical protein, partial [Fulvivirga sediminis]|nr:hypothetical protein [Fulvivirga sediminis]